MIDRRDALVGLGCVAALATAEWLRPRERLNYMPAGTPLSALVPATVGYWSAAAGGDIVVPRTEGSLASRLYDDQLARLYQDPVGALPEVMMLAAYGRAQSDVLQLHRPEVCYPATGFEITARRFVDVPLQGGKTLPAVALTARAGSRVEDIVYWTRVGRSLPRTASEQRSDRLRAALNGYVGDGVLVRASALRQEGGPLFGALGVFLKSLVQELNGPARLAMLGPELASA